MSVADHFDKLALAALLSAGHALTPGLKRAVQRAAWTAPASAVYGAKGAQRDAVCDILEKVGFRPDRQSDLPDVLPDVTGETDSRPAAGHAVRILNGWSIAKPGALAVLSGPRGWKTKAFTIGIGGHYWEGHDDSAVYLSAGGPSSILRLHADKLKRTEDWAPVSFWRFRDTPAANTGIYYTRRVPVWAWSGDDSDLENLNPDGTPYAPPAENLEA